MIRSTVQHNDSSDGSGSNTKSKRQLRREARAVVKRGPARHRKSKERDRKCNVRSGRGR